MVRVRKRLQHANEDFRARHPRTRSASATRAPGLVVRPAARLLRVLEWDRVILRSRSSACRAHPQLLPALRVRRRNCVASDGVLPGAPELIPEQKRLRKRRVQILPGDSCLCGTLPEVKVVEGHALAFLLTRSGCFVHRAHEGLRPFAPVLGSGPPSARDVPRSLDNAVESAVGPARVLKGRLRLPLGNAW
eukprot:scaffold5011_cov255-Pinguiococcus_pyrenoidosus.AAC.3